MQNSIIICTAGHVDHGKTALVKALTGIDCDTHPEEKQRGITINLGYAYLHLPSGQYLAFIDVPGHHHFINTMVSGASGVDYAILVVAADDSVMPQTIEHLKIMELLGIKRGLIAITKTDLVDEQLLNACAEEIKELVKSTFLAGSPMFKVSVQTGSGMQELKKYLYGLSSLSQENQAGKIFRMYIDRVFVAKGFGTVVTGSTFGGTIRKGDQVYLSPINKISKIRQIQKHNSLVSEISKGERAALNLIDIDRNFLEPGVMISDRALEATSLADAQVTLLDNNRSLRTNSKVIFLTGSFKTEATIYLLSCDTLKSGQSAFVQISFYKSFVLFRKDRFIIRSTSADITLGGGIVLDPYPLRHVRKTERLLRHMNILSSFADEDYILTKMEQSIAPVSLQYFIDVLQDSENKILELVNHKLLGKVFSGKSNGAWYLLSSKHKDLIRTDFFSVLQKIFTQDYDTELTLPAIIKLSKAKQMIISEELINEFLVDFIKAKKLIQTARGFKQNNDQLTQVDLLVDELQKQLNRNQKNLVLFDDLMDDFKAEKKQLLKAIAVLIKRKILYQADEFYLPHSLVDSSRTALSKFLYVNKQGITVAGFRDLIGSNRKISMLLFSIFEREKIVVRKDDLRFLTQDGEKKYLDTFS